MSHHSLYAQWMKHPSYIELDKAGCNQEWSETSQDMFSQLPFYLWIRCKKPITLTPEDIMQTYSYADIDSFLTHYLDKQYPAAQ